MVHCGRAGAGGPRRPGGRAVRQLGRRLGGRGRWRGHPRGQPPHALRPPAVFEPVLGVGGYGLHRHRRPADRGQRIRSGRGVHRFGEARLRLGAGSRRRRRFQAAPHEGETVPFVTPGDNPALQGKASEWSPDNPPYYRLSDFSVRSLFLNLYYGFGGNAAWTPYVGIGAGLGRVRTNYAASFQRRTLADGYVAAAGGDPERPQEWQLGAAGTSSVLDTQLREEVFGYQLVGGVERVLREGVTAFVTVRWTGFDDIAGEDVWATIRSHWPVQADGVTPFETEQALEGIGGLALSVGIRYGF